MGAYSAEGIGSLKALSETLFRPTISPLSINATGIEFVRSNPIYFMKKNKTHFIVPSPKEQFGGRSLLANDKKR